MDTRVSHTRQGSIIFVLPVVRQFLGRVLGNLESSASRSKWLESASERVSPLGFT